MEDARLEVGQWFAVGLESLNCTSLYMLLPTNRALYRSRSGSTTGNEGQARTLLSCLAHIKQDYRYTSKDAWSVERQYEQRPRRDCLGKEKCVPDLQEHCHVSDCMSRE